MSVSVIRQRLLKPPRLYSRKSLMEEDRPRRRSMAHYLRFLLKVGVGLLTILLLLTVVWVIPVS